VGTVPPKSDSKGPHILEFEYLGHKHYSLTLIASTLANQKKWYEAIVKQQNVIRERNMWFETVTLSDGFFGGGNQVRCAAPYSKWLFVTDEGSH